MSEKANMVQRLLGPLGLLGVNRVLMMPDATGISAAILRAITTHRAQGSPVWPTVDFVALNPTGEASDSARAAQLMQTAGVRLIVVLGGDGTHRVVAGATPEVPLATLSSGTNNVFPDLREATITGIAAALFATGCVGADVALRPNKCLHVNVGELHEIALVDVCVTSMVHVGARAVWEPGTITELFVSFAEPDAIGLSSIAAMIEPITRDEPRGAHLRCAATGRPVLAAIAPGMLERLEIGHFEAMQPGVGYRVQTDHGSIALDGEREIELHPGLVAEVSLQLSGPQTLNVPATLAAAVQSGVMARQARHLVSP